jgi:hypothetical protein
MKPVWLSNKQWESRLSAIQTRNMKQYKRSYTRPTIARDLSGCIIEFDTEGNVNVDYDAYNELRKTAGVIRKDGEQCHS